MKVHSEKSMCLAGNFVDRNTNQNGSGVKEDTSFTLNTVDRHAVAYRELQYDSYIEDNVSGTLKKSGGALGGGFGNGGLRRKRTAGLDRPPIDSAGMQSIARVPGWMGGN